MIVKYFKLRGKEAVSFTSDFSPLHRNMRQLWSLPITLNEMTSVVMSVVKSYPTDWLK